MSGIGLWPDSPEFDDVDVPLPDDVRARVQEWVDEYGDHIGDPELDWNPEHIDDHNRRGHELSLGWERRLAQASTWSTSSPPRRCTKRSAQLDREPSPSHNRAYRTAERVVVRDVTNTDRKAVTPLVASGLVTVLLAAGLGSAGLWAADALDAPAVLGVAVGLLIAYLLGQAIARRAASSSRNE